MPSSADPYYVMKIGRLPLVPYHRPGDPALGAAVRGLAGKHCAVMLANHGPVVSGATLAAAVYAAEELEETARLFCCCAGCPPGRWTARRSRSSKPAFKLDI
jgi:ribulose-5-phosphate 4-epimerase/fuculose-1-phosphate aldolase